MGAVFVKILNMSLTAGWIVLAVILVRLFLKKKAPKALFPILWALVAVRLVCPVVFESSFSLIPHVNPVSEKALSSEGATTEPPAYPESTDPEAVKKFAEEYEIYIDEIAQPEKVMVSVVSIPENTENSDEVDYIIDEIDPEETKLPDEIMDELEAHGSYTETTEDGVTNTYTLVRYAMLKKQKPSVYGILGTIWLAGAAAMLLYMGFSYLHIYRKVKESAPEEKNIRICDGIDSPFILGLVRPKIYLPPDISATDKEYVLAHEKAHIKRFDHVWKPFGFLLLSVYWFHPLLWVAYVVLCKDIEYACDEKVIKELGVDQKKDYSTALINCSVSRKMISACPLAFGENGVKGRVTSVLHYKKPAFWIILLSVVVCTVLAVCFLTNPEKKAEQPKPGDIITFGTYEQDNITENGAEPIEWIVVDVFDGKATLLSKYGLDAKPFHEEGAEGVTWEESSLRNWLNSEFIETAFSEKEQEQIVTTKLDNHSSSSYNVKDGEDTEDKVYLLSIDELYQIYKTQAGLNESAYRNTDGITTATAYAKAQGAWEGKTEEGASASPWVLRTLGVSDTSVCRVNTDGTLSLEVSNDYRGNAIRPTMRIELQHAEYEITESAEGEEKVVYTGSGRFKDTVALEEAKPGYVVEFGSYEQNQDTSDGAEPMEWYVLEVKNGRALLLSKYILENMPYHNFEEDISWENCTLREWLNGTFYDSAFDDEEKKRIATTLLENIWNPWNPNASYEYTEDKVFLPSMEDMLSGDYDYIEKVPEIATHTFDGYFNSNTERMAREVYEEEQWVYYGEGGRLQKFDGSPYSAYWLRASSRVEYKPSDERKEVPYLVVSGITVDGSLDKTANNQIIYNNGVRPAIWVELGNLEEIAEKNAKEKAESEKKKGTFFLSNKLPERYDYKEVKETFLEYLNHQAYLYPAEYSREKWKCTFEVYSTTDSKMKRVYLKAQVNGEERWYLCTPTVYLEEDAPLTVNLMEAASVESLVSSGAVTYLGTDTVKISAASAPEYHKNTELDTTDYKESIALISDVLCKNGYLQKDENGIDVIKLEAWISEFDMEKKLYPYVYIVINDSYVYETSFTKYRGLYTTFCNDNFAEDYSLKEHFGELIYMPDEFDGRNIKPLASVDRVQLEHVKDCAVLHYVHEPDFSVTITVDGKEVTLPKQNVCIKQEDSTGIAFVPKETAGGITRYHIYRSTDGGNRWTLVSRNFETNAEEIAAIELPDEEYVVCYFNRIGTTYHSTCYYSEDGGVTWSMPKQADKPKVALADADVGTSVVFGSYEQDFDLENGKEPLEWIVLDRVGNKVLLLSRFGLESDWYYEYTTWEESGTRRELNEYFYVNAFSTKERERIVKTAVKTPSDTGVDIVTEDYVFLLSESEVSEGKAQDGTTYFKEPSARLTIPVPSYGTCAWVYSDCESSDWDGIQTKWMLRADGSNMQKVWVEKDGTVKDNGTDHEFETVAVLLRPAVWVDVSGLTGTSNRVPEDTSSGLQPADSLKAEIESTNISIAIGDEYAAYLDEEGKLHVLYDTSYKSEYDPVGATGGIDLTKTYKTLGTDPWRLVAIDEEGKLSVSYHMTAEELSAYAEEAIRDAMEHNGNYGAGGPQPGIAKDFEGMFGVKQIFSTYPYNTYTVLFENGAARRDRFDVAFLDVVQITDYASGVIAGLKADGTLVMSEIADADRKKKLESWPDKLKQIYTYTNMAGLEKVFVGLREDGTVICEGVEHEYFINTIEKWCGIVKIAAGYETIVGLKGDGTVVAVCPGRSDKGQCEVDNWTDVIAVNTNGKVTVGITKNGKVLMAGDVPEVVQSIPEYYNYNELRTLLLEHLNHQAWLYPSEYPQESYTCEYELYRMTSDTTLQRVFLKAVIGEKEYWFDFQQDETDNPESPVRIVAREPEVERYIENGFIVWIGSDKIGVPAVKQPVYETNVDFSGDISEIYAELKQNGYGDNLRMEVIISACDMEKKLFPYVYLVINDFEVYETAFTDEYSLFRSFYDENNYIDYSMNYGTGNPWAFDGRGIKPLDSVDAEQFERVKACATVHKVFVEKNTEEVLIDGMRTEVPDTNVAINEELGVGIVFVPQWCLSNIVHYNIYRSEDSGKSWQMIAEDYTATEGGIARILIPEKDTIVCYFNKSGTTSQSSCEVSKDGGATWSDVSHHSSKPNTFTYDPQKDTSVIFGAYEQDGDFLNGKEPLEWIVLDRDGDRALLLSRYGIETMQYDKDKMLETWEVDELYWMMSRTIYEYAFSSEERKALIQMTPIENRSVHFTNRNLLYPGYTFLLETDDVLYGQGQNETPYFRTEESRITIPTAYVAQKGAWLDESGEFAGVESPWLLTVTGTTDEDFSEVKFARVMPDGSISLAEEEIKKEYVLIRPAIWVDVTKLPKPEWMN